MNKFKKQAIIFVAQGAYTGRFPIAPGTAGSVLGVLLYLGMVKTFSPGIYFLIGVFLFVVGTWSATRAEELLGKKDHSSIVIDEIVGYLISMFLVPFDWRFVIAGFVLFRIFDVLKPYPLQRIQRIHGGLGVMLDDVGAGIYTNFILQVAVPFFMTCVSNPM